LYPQSKSMALSLRTTTAIPVRPALSKYSPRQSTIAGVGADVGHVTGVGVDVGATTGVGVAVKVGSTTGVAVGSATGVDVTAAVGSITGVQVTVGVGVCGKADKRNSAVALDSVPRERAVTSARAKPAQQPADGKANVSRKRPSGPAFGPATTSAGQTPVGSASSTTSGSFALHPCPTTAMVTPGTPSGGAIWIAGTTTGVGWANHPEGEMPRDCIKIPPINTASTRINKTPTTDKAINIQVDHLSKPPSRLFVFSISHLPSSSHMEDSIKLTI
jgi:hypothetical protein